MTHDADREQEIFGGAMERSGDERAAYLEAACSGDAALRERIESLVEAMEGVEQDGFLDNPTGGSSGGGPAGPVDSHADEMPGSVIGKFRLVERIGEGGFGTVFLAEQTEPISRRVALKVIKLGMDTKQVIARFEAERQALALMDHPGIARVYDAGATHRGRPFFAMELVRGAPITRFADNERLSVAERLRLFQDVCAAVQHAHQKGVIHRDLKPSNVLVSDQDGKTLPKVIDFGVAKAVDRRLTEQSMHTADHQVVGTPAYMSPEQAGLDRGDVDTRSDVYSLGVLLYELLTGGTPFEASSGRSGSHDDAMRTIREITPPKPSTRLSGVDAIGDIAAARQVDPKRLQGEVRGDLDWIVMRALEKDRSRRYESPGAMAADIGRFLRNETVDASPPSLGYSARKFARRHRAGIVFGALLAVAVAGGVIGIGVFAMRAVESEQDAIEQARTANRELERATEIRTLLTDMLTSVTPEVARGRDTTVLRSILDSTAARLDDGEVNDPSVRADIGATLAEVYRKIGNAEEAEPFARSVYKYRSESTGAASLATAEARSALAVTLEDKGDWFGAKTLYEENVEALAGGELSEHPVTIRSRYELLNLLAQGVPDPEIPAQFETLYQDSKRVLGDEDALTLTVGHALARQYSALKRTQESHDLLVGVVDAMRRTMDPDDPAVFLTINTLGVNKMVLGQFDEAEALVREALDRSERILGEDHPRFPSMLDSFAYLMLLTEQYEESVETAERSIGLRTAALGPDHPAVIGSSANFGGILSRAGHIDRAAEVLSDSLERSRRVLGPRHPITLRALNNVGSTLVNQGKPAEALPILEETLAVKRETFGPENPTIYPTLSSLASVQAQLGDTDAAESMYRDLLRMQTDGLAATHADRLETVRRLAQLLLETEAFEGALELLNAEMPAMREAWGEGNPALLATRVAMVGQAAEGMGNLVGATDAFGEAFELAGGETAPTSQTRAIAETLARLYDARHSAEPDSGFDAEAERFRAHAALEPDSAG